MRFKKTQSKIERILKKNYNILLEIGGGDRKGTGGWINLDLTDNCDLYWDVRKGLPFPDDSIEKIYSSHFLEHLSFREGLKLLKESHRILKKGGKFSICVPNAMLYIEAYCRKKNLDSKQFFRYQPAYNNTTSIDNGFNVHISYKAQLQSYKKKYFDPFRRRKKFYYKYNKEENKYFYTTIGQLNFFRWIFSIKFTYP